MKEVSSREIQLNLSKYLLELPIAITKYNVVVARIVGLDTGVAAEYISELEQRIKQLESNVGVSAVKSESMVVKREDKYISRRCEFYRYCSELSVGTFTMGQIIDGQWKEQPFKHLCQKHADFVVKDKQASWEI